jgi:4a-hydroxytetrahydrobiopterin dehydratase
LTDFSGAHIIGFEVRALNRGHIGDNGFIDFSGVNDFREGWKKMDFASRKCRPLSLKAGDIPMAPGAIAEALQAVPGWELRDGAITREFAFNNHYEAIAFVNAVAWVSHTGNHHPDMAVGYNRCRVGYSTHSVGGISENDFICAAKVNALAGMGDKPD